MYLSVSWYRWVLILSLTHIVYTGDFGNVKKVPPRPAVDFTVNFIAVFTVGFTVDLIVDFTVDWMAKALGKAIAKAKTLGEGSLTIPTRGLFNLVLYNSFPRSPVV